MNSLYWHIMQTDIFFRLFYGKPSAMCWSRNHVNPPTLSSTSTHQPNAAQVIILVVWLRSTMMTTDILRVLDSDAIDCDQKVDDFCHQVEELIDDFDLVRQYQTRELESRHNHGIIPGRQTRFVRLLRSD